ncbi:hypothetical protein Nepgr_025413 [Nepenthes gracilis]|uniref:RING-type domain-containing protein n=1 Tax=Nepenthes gracilis TaxID=150966 RepID=A0AAD3T524_NEPGR|nr:hypothetical protein Nepgr_025413 [Nepenthes gracilis]
MGAACCVAARDRTIQHGSQSEILHRNIQNSPSRSFRWDNRSRVAGEDTPVNWLPDGISRSDASDLKSTTGPSAQGSDVGSSLENCTTRFWCKSLMNEATARCSGPSACGKSLSQSTSMEVKDSTGSPQISYPVSVKLSPSVLLSPVSSQSHLLPPILAPPSRRVCRSPGDEPPQGRSESQSSGRNSPSIYSISEERHVSHGKSSDRWSLLPFSELLPTTLRERWSFGSESCSLPHEKTARSNNRSVDLQTCGVCSKLLSEKLCSPKTVACDESSVVAVLICGHVYHAECLENITPEINKYDPICLVCTFGEKQASQLSGKVLRAERDSKGKSYKKSRNRVVDTDDCVEYDYWKSDQQEGKDPKMCSSSSLKSSSGKPFLRRHFSLGSKGAKSASESLGLKRKGLFWTKSSRG